MMTNPHIFGTPVVVDTRMPDRPRFELSEKVPVTGQFRREFDQWARGFFGTVPPMFKIGETLITNENGLRLIARECLKHPPMPSFDK